MVLDVREMVWARLAARVQKSREELIGILGLINQINTIGFRESSLSSAADAICTQMANQLLLEYCGLFLEREDGSSQEGYGGLTPPPWLEAEIQNLIASHTVGSESLAWPQGRRQVLILPLMNDEQRMGSLVVVPAKEPDEKDQRHFKLAADALASALEKYLLRDQLEDVQHLLEQNLQLHQSGIMELKKKNLRSEAYLDNLLLKAPIPIFLLDEEGKLLKFNQALERLLGWEGNKLAGHSLQKFFPQAGHWEMVHRALRKSEAPQDSFVEITVQDGRRLPVCMSLVSLGTGQARLEYLGSFRPVAQDPFAENVMRLMEKADQLYKYSVLAAGETMEVMAALRAGLQILLMGDLDNSISRRLTMLEELTHEGSETMSSLRRAMDDYKSSSHRQQANTLLWEKQSESSLPLGAILASIPKDPDPSDQS